MADGCWWNRTLNPRKTIAADAATITTQPLAHCNMPLHASCGWIKNTRCAAALGCTLKDHIDPTQEMHEECWIIATRDQVQKHCKKSQCLATDFSTAGRAQGKEHKRSEAPIYAH